MRDSKCRTVHEYRSRRGNQQTFHRYLLIVEPRILGNTIYSVTFRRIGNSRPGQGCEFFRLDGMNPRCQVSRFGAYLGLSSEEVP